MKELPGSLLDYTSHMPLQRCILASPGSCHKTSRALVGQPCPALVARMASALGQARAISCSKENCTQRGDPSEGPLVLEGPEIPETFLVLHRSFRLLGCNLPGMGDLDLFKLAFLQPFVFSTQLFIIEEAADDLCWNVLMSSIYFLLELFVIV